MNELLNELHSTTDAPTPSAPAGTDVETPAGAPADDVRARIVAAAARLIAEGGREAATTRAVSAAAGVQPPALYRHFGDMRGLLDTVARATFAAYVRDKAAHDVASDPVEALRHGWDRHVAFGLAHPAVFTLLYGDPTAAPASDGAAATPEAVRDGEAVLRGLVTRIAAAGRLRVSVPHATRLIHAAGTGVTLSLIATPFAARDPRLSASLREAVLAAITTVPAADSSECTPAPSAGRVATRAVALRAVLGEATPDVLTSGERQLLGEWLDRLAGDRPR